MNLLSIDRLNLAAITEQLVPWEAPRSMPTQSHHSLDLLQCTPTGSEAPDPRYWTEYDYFMLAREARAKRREYVYALFARAWGRLAARLARRRGARGVEPSLQRS